MSTKNDDTLSRDILVEKPSNVTVQAIDTLAACSPGLNARQQLHEALECLGKFRRTESRKKQDRVGKSSAAKSMSARGRLEAQPWVRFRKKLCAARESLDSALDGAKLGATHKETLAQIAKLLEATDATIAKTERAHTLLNWHKTTFQGVFRALKYSPADGQLNYDDLAALVLASNTDWVTSPCSELVGDYHVDPGSLAADLKEWMRRPRARGASKKK